MNIAVNFLFGLLGIAIMYLAAWVQQGRAFSLKAHIADATIAVVIVGLLAYAFRAANLAGWFFHILFVFIGGASKYVVSWVVAKTQGK